MQQLYALQPFHSVMQVAQVSDERAEAEAVAVHIQQVHAQGRLRWGDMAILYRTNAQSRLFEEQLVGSILMYPYVILCNPMRYCVTLSGKFSSCMHRSG